jgi:hypothetical protein
MSLDIVVAIVCLAVLAGAHSLLGEAKVIGPLLAGELPAAPLSAPFLKRVLRFAWHLTSVAWLGLAACLAVAPSTAWIVGLVLVVSAAVTLVAARGWHFAWAIFALGGLAALHRYQIGPPPAWLAWAGATVATALGALHVGWALRGAPLAAVVPHRAGRPVFVPGRAAAVAVAGALFGLAAVFLARAGVVALPGSSILALIAAAVFALRTIGDFRSVGLFRRPGGDAFSRNDAALYTPLCFALAAALAWLH